VQASTSLRATVAKSAIDSTREAHVILGEPPRITNTALSTRSLGKILHEPNILLQR
jgi:hypothetical protein